MGHTSVATVYCLFFFSFSFALGSIVVSADVPPPPFSLSPCRPFIPVFAPPILSDSSNHKVSFTVPWHNHPVIRQGPRSPPPIDQPPQVLSSLTGSLYEHINPLEACPLAVMCEYRDALPLLHIRKSKLTRSPSCRRVYLRVFGRCHANVTGHGCC